MGRNIFGLEKIKKMTKLAIFEKIQKEDLKFTVIESDNFDKNISKIQVNIIRRM